MAADPQRGLTEYVAAVAAGTATPGGGSVAAVVGALAAALGEMVANLSPGRGHDAAPLDARDAARDRLTALREEFLAAAVADEVAYERYRHATAMPRRNAEEKAARRAAMQAALLTATEEPLRVARAAAEAARLLETVAAQGNPHLRTDTALGALLARTALEGSLLNVRGNAALLADERRAVAYQSEADQLAAEGVAAAERAHRSATRRS